MAQNRLMKKEKAFIDKLSEAGGKALYELTPEEARQVLLDVQNTDVDIPEARKQKISIKLKDGSEMPVVIMRPADIDDILPVVFYIHGGGWVMGDEATHDRLIRELADNVPAAVVFPVYCQSPEAQFPKTTDDLFFVLEQIVKNAGEFGLDASQVAVAGDSVGGNMATVMALMAKAQGNSPKIDFQLLFYPVTDADFSNESYQEFANGPWLTKKAMEWFWDQYAPDKKDRKNIYASPLKASIEQLKGLPPALIITDENDVLRDEGEAYARKLDVAGVETTAIRLNGTFHDFVMLNALADTAATRAAIDFAVSRLQEVFFAE